MDLLHCIMIWIFAFFLVSVRTQDFPGTDYASLFGMAFETKCLKYVEPSEFANIMNSFGNSTKCFPHDNFSPDSFCKDYEKVDEACQKEMMYTMKKCLDSDEQYFPDFVLEGQKRSVERMCAEGANYIERLKSLANITCQTGDISKMLQKELSLKCVPHLKIIKNLEKNVISLNLKDVCSDLQLFRDCIVGALDKKCYLSKDSRDVILGIFGDQLKSCIVTNEATSTTYGAINNIVYIILGIATWIVNKRY